MATSAKGPWGPWRNTWPYSKEKNIIIHDLLYRGVRAYGLITDDISYGFSANSLDCDFGRELYTTPRIEYAIKHIEDCGNIRVGALMVFDWTDHV